MSLLDWANVNISLVASGLPRFVGAWDVQQNALASFEKEGRKRQKRPGGARADVRGMWLNSGSKKGEKRHRGERADHFRLPHSSLLFGMHGQLAKFKVHSICCYVIREIPMKTQRPW